ncbi:MAG: hypothetical protein AAF988_03535 [Pseudomonadota bacterium]
MADGLNRKERRDARAAEAEAKREAAADAGYAPQESGNWFTRLFGSNAESLEMQATRAALPGMSPNAILDKMAEQAPEVQALTDAIKADPALAASFKNALVRDPSMLEGIMSIQDGSSNIDVNQLAEGLSNANTRRIFKEVLDKIAENPDDQWNFATVNTLAGHLKNNEMQKAGALLGQMGVSTGMEFDFGDFIEFLRQLMENPELAVNNLVNTLVDAGQIDAEMANAVKGYAVEASGFLKFMAEDWVELADNNQDFLATTHANNVAQGQAIGDRYGHAGETAAQVQARISAEANQAGAMQTASVQTGEGMTQTASLSDPANGGVYDLAALGISPEVTAAQERLLREHDARNGVETIPVTQPMATV